LTRTVFTRRLEIDGSRIFPGLDGAAVTRVLERD
jgi:hypothetical protein